MARVAVHVAVVTLLALLPAVRAICADNCGAPPGEPARAVEPACHDAQGNDGATHLPDTSGSGSGCDHSEASQTSLAWPAAKHGPDRVELQAAVAPLSLPVAVASLIRPVIADRTPTPPIAPAGFLPPLRC